jgi:hypothetical protein
VLADIYAVISPGLRYGGQRDAAALAVAELPDGNCRTDDLHPGLNRDEFYVNLGCLRQCVQVAGI